MEKVTFITTIYNESKTIERFLDSIAQQIQFPDEIVIVDAFSEDNTFEKVNSFFKSHKKEFEKVDIKLLQKKGNRSIGRNFAIANATNNIIAATDAGCILEEHWLERIVKPFANRDIDVVSGYYLAKTRNNFEKALATYMCVMPDRVDPQSFLPSSRSVAFRKSAWKDVHGYPEDIELCEDLVFDRALKRQNKRFVFVADAIVYWPQRHTIFEAAQQFFSYAYGDGQAKYVRKNTPFLFGRYLVAFIFLIAAIVIHSMVISIFLAIMFLLYIVWAIQKNIRYVPPVSALFYLPILQFIADFAVMSGMIAGILSTWDIPKPQSEASHG